VWQVFLGLAWGRPTQPIRPVSSGRRRDDLSQPNQAHEKHLEAQLAKPQARPLKRGRAAAKSERRARGASGGRTENSSAPPQPLREQRCLCTTASRSSTDATTRSAPASPDPLFFNSDPLLSSVTVAERAELSCALLDGCSGGMVLDEMPKRAVDSGFSKLPFRSGWCL